MECYVCKKEIESLSKASRVGVGGGLSLMGHDRCWAALNAVASPETRDPSGPDPAPKPIGKTINKAIRKHRPDEVAKALNREVEVAEVLNREVDWSDVPVGSTTEYEGTHYVVGWQTRKGLQPWHPSEQALQEMKKGVC